MEIVFMGTPDFAVVSLDRIYNNSEIGIKAVVTQPDRPRGRGQKLRPTPVKTKAEELGLSVLQSDNINRKDFIDSLNKINPEAIVVVAFGQKISKEILELPKYGCINLHASLLPEYRGAGPIHQVIIDGQNKTGVTTMYMDEGWDTGDIIYKKEINIGIDVTVGILHDKLADIGADLLVKTLLDINEGTAPREKQDQSQATYASKINKEIGEIDWSMNSHDIYNLVRGVNPWPGAYTYFRGKIMKIWKASISKKDYNNKNNNPGEIVKANDDEGLIVKTGDGLIALQEIQLPGKKRCYCKDFLHGYDIDEKERLGR